MNLEVLENKGTLDLKVLYSGTYQRDFYIYKLYRTDIPTLCSRVIPQCVDNIYNENEELLRESYTGEYALQLGSCGNCAPTPNISHFSILPGQITSVTVNLHCR